MLLYAERLIFLLQHHGQIHIEGGVLVGERVVVGVLHVAASVLTVEFGIHVAAHKIGVQVFDGVHPTTPVHHWLGVVLGVAHNEGRNASLFGHAGIVGTKCGGNVHNARTVFGGNVVARNHLKGFALGLNPGYELLVGHAHQIAASELGHHAVGYLLVARLVAIKVELGGVGGHVGVQAFLGHQCGHGLIGVGVVGLHQHVAHVGMYG